MPERLVYINLIQANCDVLFSEHAPVHVVTRLDNGQHRIVVLSSKTGQVLLERWGTSHGDFSQFCTYTEERLGVHIAEGWYKGERKADQKLEEEKRRNEKVEAEVEKLNREKEEELQEVKRANEALIQEKQVWLASALDDQKRRNQELMCEIERLKNLNQEEMWRNEKAVEKLRVQLENSKLEIEARARLVERQQLTPDTWSEINSH
ncbi:hypothetical protein FN846DRAFT_1018055 [Sphaerosporella brunnea]|uniref:Uncharacterized protein n=1 Tax=Sphaerosporella brunnea TaxID=1250544 RepID=A0A5J5FBH2_9PEZI|nr:hypothetical protein FN846DRAFT_1018055 [Sphaerosporella brunnea]